METDKEVLENEEKNEEKEEDFEFFQIIHKDKDAEFVMKNAKRNLEYYENLYQLFEGKFKKDINPDPHKIIDVAVIYDDIFIFTEDGKQRKFKKRFYTHIFQDFVQAKCEKVSMRYDPNEELISVQLIERENVFEKPIKYSGKVKLNSVFKCFDNFVHLKCDDEEVTISLKCSDILTVKSFKIKNIHPDTQEFIDEDRQEHVCYFGTESSTGAYYAMAVTKSDDDSKFKFDYCINGIWFKTAPLGKWDKMTKLYNIFDNHMTLNPKIIQKKIKKENTKLDHLTNLQKIFESFLNKHKMK